MRVGVVASASIAEHGRLDAPFNLLQAEHAPLVEELVAAFTVEELTDLVVRLPFDVGAADAVFPTTYGHSRSSFLTYVASPNLRRGTRPEARWKRELAVYIAAASQFAVAKLKEELLALAKQRLAVVTAFKALTDLAAARRATHLQAALRRDPADLAPKPARAKTRRKA